MVDILPIGLGSFTETDVASATTCDIGAVSTIFVRITGTTTITSFGAGTNRWRFIRFASALTLTHNAVSLLLPTNASIAVEAGDTCLARSTAIGNWIVVQYQRDTGVALAAGALDADLVAIAALTTTSYGRGLLELANAAALRTAGGLVIGSDVQAQSTALDEWAGKARPAGATVGTTDTQTLTNKTITFAGNTLTGVQAQSTALDEWALKARPGGTTVGTSDTQTLTNKTLTSPILSGFSAAEARAVCAALGIWCPLAVSTDALTVSAVTTQETLATIVIPAGAMGPNGALRWIALWEMTNGADDKIPRATFGGTVFSGPTFTASASFHDMRVVKNVNSQSVQVGHSAPTTTGFGATTGAVTTGAINTSVAQNLVFSGQKETMGNVLSLRHYIVEVLYGA